VRLRHGGPARSRKETVKRLEKAVYIGLVVVNMWADAHAAKPRRNVNPLSGKATYDLFRHSIAKAKADNVGCPKSCFRYRKAFSAQTIRQQAAR